MRNRGTKALPMDVAASYAAVAYTHDTVGSLIAESERLRKHTERATAELARAAMYGDKGHRVVKLINLIARNQTKRGIVLDQVARLHNEAAMREQSRLIPKGSEKGEPIGDLEI